MYEGLATAAHGLILTETPSVTGSFREFFLILDVLQSQRTLFKGNWANPGKQVRESNQLEQASLRWHEFKSVAKRNRIPPKG